jgi:hypothetical protein
MNYGYNLTLGQLKDRFDEFQSVLGRHGVEVTAEYLSSGPPAEVVT